jgi:ABC-2 type transport system permease protein
MASTQYSHVRALRAYVKASLTAMSRNPSSMIFGFIFPFIFILIFGFMGNRTFRVDIGLLAQCDTSNLIYEKLSNIQTLRLVREPDDAVLLEKLKKGEIEAIVDIQKLKDQADARYVIKMTTSNASSNTEAFLAMMDGITAELNIQMSEIKTLPITVKTETIEGRKYKAIDFILPGQLGFVILSTGVFGAAYVLITLKQRLIIKRFFATPAKGITILLGESLSRLIFAVIQVTVIVLIGTYTLGFTLIHGFATLMTLLFISAAGLLVFFGFGLIVSNIAKNEHAVPPVANLIVLPQILLAGTFFPITAFPDWLQPVCRVLPLTYVNDALRKISFDGAGLLDLGAELAVLAIWGVIIFAVNVRIFKWE